MPLTARHSSQLSAYLDRISRIDSNLSFFDDGYRGWTYSYRAMAEMASMWKEHSTRTSLRSATLAANIGATPCGTG
jgi:hypothetical protein